MADVPGTYGGWRDDADQSWGPARSVRSTPTGAGAARRSRRWRAADQIARAGRRGPAAAGSAGSGSAASAGRAGSVDRTASERAGSERAGSERAVYERTGSERTASERPATVDRDRPVPTEAGSADRQPRYRRSTRERGLPGWGALLVLIVIAGVGGVIDMARGTHVRGAFNIAFVIAAIVAILVVRRSSMFAIVVAPPIVYTAATLGTVYLRSGGLKDKKVLFDAAASWLVYGFPAIAAATAAVLIIAGIRLIIRR